MDAMFTIRMPSLAADRESEAHVQTAPKIAIPREEPSDEALMASLCEGDQGALASLFRRYARMVRGLAYRVLRDAAEADDLLQDVFLLIHRLCTRFDPSKGSARTWILQMTYRRAISRRRYLTARHFYNRADLDEAAEQLRDPRALPGQDDSLMSDFFGNSKDLWRIVEELPENQRTTLKLFFFEGYTFAEIAAKLGQTAGNVSHHYYRGLDKLRKLVFSGRLPGGKAV